jgi:hypothetical protein
MRTCLLSKENLPTRRARACPRRSATPRAWSWAALMHRAFGIDVLACAHCGGRLRLIATLHAPAVIRKILAHRALSHSGQSPGPAPRPDWIGSGARRTPSCWCREVAFVLIGPVRRPIDGSGLSGLACRLPGPARSTCEEDADVRCSIGSCGVPRPPATRTLGPPRSRSPRAGRVAGGRSRR